MAVHDHPADAKPGGQLDRRQAIELDAETAVGQVGGPQRKELLDADVAAQRQDAAVVAVDRGQAERQRQVWRHGVLVLDGRDPVLDPLGREQAGDLAAQQLEVAGVEAGVGDREGAMGAGAGLGQLGEQVRAALGEHPAVAAFGQRVNRRPEVDGVLARDDDLRVPAQLVPPGGRGAGRGDDDRACVRRGRGDERAVRVEIEPPGDHRDRRRRRPALPQVTPQLLWPGRLVLLLADRGRPDQDDVAQRAEQREHPPVGIGGDSLRDAVQRGGTVRGRDHVRTQPAAVRVTVEPGQIRFVGEKLAQAHWVDRSTTTAWSRTSISFFGGWIAPGTPDAVSMMTSQPAA